MAEESTSRRKLPATFFVNLVAGGLLILIIPEIVAVFAKMFEDLGGTPPAVTQLVIDIFLPLSEGYLLRCAVYISFVGLMLLSWFKIHSERVRFTIQNILFFFFISIMLMIGCVLYLYLASWGGHAII